MNSPEILYTETPDRTQDMGPMCRGGTIVWFGTIACGLAAVALTILGSQTVPAFCWIPAVALGIPFAYGIWCIYASHRDRVDAPKSHAVLGGELGFDVLCTCRGVAATAFFAPDSIFHGGSTQLMLFLENYMSRQRVVTVRFGHLPRIGRPEATYVRLHLAAGQAAVYVMPVRAQSEIGAGYHRLSVTIEVDQSHGVGQKLLGARTSIHDMRKVRFAAPFELSAGRPEPEDKTPLGKPRYISLASVSEKQPDLERLHALLA